jgi:hypothetical protein
MVGRGGVCITPAVQHVDLVKKVYSVDLCKYKS